MVDDVWAGATPIIFLTAHAEIQDRVHDLGSSGLDCLSKPFDPVELVGRLRTLLSSRALDDGQESRQGKLQELRALLD